MFLTGHKELEIGENNIFLMLWTQLLSFLKGLRGGRAK
jgi:hypothetical protein